MAKALHDFQPIIDEACYSKALNYISKEAGKLVLKILGQSLPQDTITIFSQNEPEYEFLADYLKSHGKISPLAHGVTLYVDVQLEINGQGIKLLGVRQPDETRTEVGYADFPVTDYGAIKRTHVADPFVQEIHSGSGMNLLELVHPDFDVRGYIVER